MAVRENKVTTKLGLHKDAIQRRRDPFSRFSIVIVAQVLGGCDYRRLQVCGCGHEIPGPVPGDRGRDAAVLGPVWTPAKPRQCIGLHCGRAVGVHVLGGGSDKVKERGRDAQ